MRNLRKVFLVIVVALMVVFIIWIFCQAHCPTGPNFDSEIGKGIIALLAMMIIDFIVGLINAIFFKKSKKSSHGGLSSKIGTQGLIKKSLILILVFAIHILQQQTTGLKDFPYIFIATVTGFSMMEFISILENLILMGVPFPKKLKSIFEIIRKEKPEDKKETKEDDNNERID